MRINIILNKVIFLTLLSATVLITSCSKSDRGYVVGVQDREDWHQQDPFGMLFIPHGSYNMGQSDQDVPYSHLSQSKTVTVTSFYMDETEITNNEYRQFVYWVRDSIARRLLGELDDEYLIMEDEYGEMIDPPFLNWRKRINWDGEQEREALEALYYQEHERYFRKKELDVRKLNYEYWWIDYKEAARKDFRNPTVEPDINPGAWTNRPQGWKDRSQFIKRDVINVYPDTLVWIHDFTYSYNEPMAKNYFSHPSYDHYPVVGVNWKQARAFSIWRTNYLNSFLENRVGMARVNDFRLPTEAEWEWAARGGLDLSPYPWGGPYARNSNGCFLGNFKPLRGNYVDDGGIYPIIVAHYAPNDYGLYDMAGNVSEWCTDAFKPSGYNFAHDLNPVYEYDAKDNDSPSFKRKVIRGGSWKDISYFMQVSTRASEYQDSGKSYVGFRNVQSYMGRMKGDGPNSSNVYRR